MERTALPDHIHILYFQEEQCCLKDERTKILAKRIKDIGITDFLVDTAKIRTFNLFSNSSKNGGCFFT